MPKTLTMITGASSGIGEALAKRYAKAGHSLILTARNSNSLKNIKEACINHGSKEVLLLSLDLALKDSIAKAAESALEWGTPEILINNAGISQRSFVLDTNIEVYDV